ncbi:MAG: PAS-domain containing protein [Rhodanobacteraceae bacterium]|nr:PAS-domain containing protein [Rhodanobacteraceae bacterium]
MLSAGTVVLAALLWLAALFGVALYAERRPAGLVRCWPYVYALSLAVYCTSWTFYGTVTQAARYGWPLPPTFIGTIALYAFAAIALVKLVRLARASNATSLADLIATRLGKSSGVAASVTVVAALGLIPYIALQLKAVSMSYAVLTRSPATAPQMLWQDGALYVALAMALFAMLFGTRRVSAAEHNRGIVLAIAFESLFKLTAMLALGAFVLFGLDLPEQIAAPPPRATAGGFLPLVLLGALAMFTLPHQFHIGVVECRDETHVRTARWLFPLYLLLIALPLLPLAQAGDTLLGGSGLSSDLYVLALPLAQGQEGLALLAFLGGLSAATGMIVVSTLSLSLMIGNHWLAPGLLRTAWSREGGDLRGTVLLLRRVGIAMIMLLAWAYNRLIAGNEALADVGAVSFSALATLTPALAFAVWRPQTPPRAVIAGIAAGFATWCWALLLPLAAQVRGVEPDWLQHGIYGQPWLAPDALFGLTGWSRLGRAVGASLFVGTLITFALAAWRPGPLREKLGFDQRALRNAGRRFLSESRLDELLRAAPARGAVPAAIEASVEHELAAVLGSASARLLLDAAQREAAAELETVAAIVGEVSQELRFNQRLLEAALENMSQGISVVDAQLRLVAWNRRYVELFCFPENMLRVGAPVAELAAWALQRLPHRDHADAALERRLQHMRAGTPHLSERVFPDGSIIEIRGNPMPSGGFVATFTDVTAFRHAEAALMRANETLEQRVAERTSLLQQAKHEAERANEAKSRFLAAVGHDLLQPLHAAHLFTDALAQQITAPEPRKLVAQTRGALDSTTDLLTGLLDMSRLEAGGLTPQLREFPLTDVLDPLASEFRALAAERRLTLRYHRSGAWVRSDPQLLRRVLQNFLANAVRYTAQGRIVLGLRRRGTSLQVVVHDTGPGITPEQQRVIFEEFRRGDDAAGVGLGLGLAIAERMAQLLNAPLTLRSRVGHGTVFGITLPRVPSPVRDGAGDSKPVSRLCGLRVLVVDNDAVSREALQRLLQGWGCAVGTAACDAEAREQLGQGETDLWLFDFHLDDGDTGVALYQRLCKQFAPRPALILSADSGDATRRTVAETGLPLLIKPIKPLALKSVLDRVLVATMAR